MKSVRGVSAAAWFFSQPGFNGLDRDQEESVIDQLADKHCEICGANMGRMSREAFAEAGRDCGCRPEG